jgi:uncharacterized membrane protein YhaH (DUF805 family)
MQRNGTRVSSRIGRGLYWSALAVLTALSVAVAPLFHRPLFDPTPDLFLGCLAWFRLHDAGRSGRIVAVWLLLQATLFAAYVTGALLPLTAPLVGWLHARSLGTVIVLLVEYGFLLWVGCLKSDPEPNRYGPPPRPGLLAVS